MRSAVVIVLLIATIAAEAPYHLPRPAPHAPSFHYHQPPPQVRPQPPAPQPNYVSGSGYFYQQPSIQPAFVQPAPQPQYQPAPQPQYQPAPQPQYLPAPQPQYQPAPQPQYQPAPQPQYQPAPQPQYVPAPVYQPAPAPAPQPSYSQPINYPSTSYGIPQPRLQIAPRPIPQPLPTYVQPQPLPAPQPISYYQNQQSDSQQGYSYSQPQPFQAASLPLQSQGLTNGISSSSLSSYQADSNLYSGVQAQTHREALDSVVLDRVQSIIKDNEHSSARDAGYLSLVSGVSLENAKPSVELTSFVHTSPLGQSSSASSSSGSSGLVSGPSIDYGLPTITANSQASQVDSSIAFLPSAKPASTYGAAN